MYGFVFDLIHHSGSSPLTKHESPKNCWEFRGTRYGPFYVDTTGAGKRVFMSLVDPVLVVDFLSGKIQIDVDIALTSPASG